MNIAIATILVSYLGGLSTSTRSTEKHLGMAKTNRVFS